MPSRVFMSESRSVNNRLSSVLKPFGDGCGLNWKWLVTWNIIFSFSFICSYILNMFFRRYRVFKVDLTLHKRIFVMPFWDWKALKRNFWNQVDRIKVIHWDHQAKQKSRGFLWHSEPCYIQLFRERLSEKMCSRQSRKVIWDMINTLFLTTVAVEHTFVAFL